MTKLKEDIYTKILSRLTDLANEICILLDITSGNCGSFAIALKKVFGEGKFVAFAHYYPEEHYPDNKSGGWGFGHVMLEIDKKLYDGVGIYEYRIAKKMWEDEGYYELKTEKDLDIQKEIPHATRYLIPHKTFEKMLKQIGNELTLL